MGHIWRGPSKSGVPTAYYADGKIWLGLSSNGFPDAQYKPSSAWTGSYSYIPDVNYGDGKVMWLGKGSLSSMPAAIYRGGQAWRGVGLGGLPDAVSDDDGALAALAIALFGW